MMEHGQTHVFSTNDMRLIMFHAKHHELSWVPRMFQGISKSSPYFPGRGAEDPRVGLLGLENMVHPASYLSLHLSISLYLSISICLFV